MHSKFSINCQKVHFQILCTNIYLYICTKNSITKIKLKHGLTAKVPVNSLHQLLKKAMWHLTALYDVFAVNVCFCDKSKNLVQCIIIQRISFSRYFTILDTLYFRESYESSFYNPCSRNEIQVSVYIQFLRCNLVKIQDILFTNHGTERHSELTVYQHLADFEFTII